MASPKSRYTGDTDKIRRWSEFLKNPQANLPQLPSAQESIEWLGEKNKAWVEKSKKRKAQRQVKAGQARLKRYQEKMRAPKKQEPKYPAHIQKEADEWLANLVSVHQLEEGGDTWEVKSAKNRLAELQDELLKIRNFQKPDEENDPQDLFDQKKAKNRLIKQRIDAINADIKKQNEIITPPAKPDPKPNPKPGNREAEIQSLITRIANGDLTAQASLDSLLANAQNDSSNVTNAKVTTQATPSKTKVKRISDMKKRSERKKRQKNISKWRNAGEVKPVMSQDEIQIYLDGGPPPQRFIDKYGEGK